MVSQHTIFLIFLAFTTAGTIEGFSSCLSDEKLSFTKYAAQHDKNCFAKTLPSSFSTRGSQSSGNNGSNFPESRARRLMRINASNWKDNLEVCDTYWIRWCGIAPDVPGATPLELRGNIRMDIPWHRLVSFVFMSGGFH